MLTLSISYCIFSQKSKDENEDGYFSLEELSNWLETNKIVKLVEEGRDTEVDEIIAYQANKMKDKDQKE
jgi:hypothetical protein